jgi:hypothetical protein
MAAIDDMVSQKAHLFYGQQGTDVVTKYNLEMSKVDGFDPTHKQ